MEDRYKMEQLIIVKNFVRNNADEHKEVVHTV
jgi:hypothetical protein